jgi:hypothetical protein
MCLTGSQVASTLLAGFLDTQSSVCLSVIEAAPLLSCTWAWQVGTVSPSSFPPVPPWPEMRGSRSFQRDHRSRGPLVLNPALGSLSLKLSTYLLQEHP